MSVGEEEEYCKGVLKVGRRGFEGREKDMGYYRRSM
jgi:hypothetical protein